MGVNIPKIIFFCKCRRIRLKLVIFLFYDLPACNKKADILRFTTAFIALYTASLIMFLHCRFLYHVLKALIFAKIGLKLSYFCKKKTKKTAKSPSAQTSLPPTVEGVAPKGLRRMNSFICLFLCRKTQNTLKQVKKGKKNLQKKHNVMVFPVRGCGRTKCPYPERNGAVIESAASHNRTT